MKKTAKRLLGFAIAVLTVIQAVLTSALAVGVSAAEAAKDPKEIERVVVDCRSAEAFAKTAYVHVHTPTEAEPDPYTGGKYSFSDAMNAMQVEYNDTAPSDRHFRILTFFNKKNSLTAEYKYLVVVYAAKTEQSFKITAWNGGRQGAEAILVSNGKDTKAKFVVSDAVDISAADAQGRSSLSRWINGIHSTIQFKTSDPVAKFFIKEYAFFKSPEDAKAYYAGVDLGKDPMEYGENAVVPTGDSTAPTTPAAPVSEPLLAPVVMSFEGADALAANAKFQNFEGDIAGIGGLQEFVTLEDGTKCVQLKPHTYTGANNTGYSIFRMMPIFSKAKTVTALHKYVRIVYMTTDKAANTVTLTNNAGRGRVVLVPDTSVSGGKFVMSDPVAIDKIGVSERYSNGVHSSFEYQSKDEKSEFYIKEMVFFSNLDDAKAYNGTIDYSKYDNASSPSVSAGGESGTYHHNYVTITDETLKENVDEPRLDPVIISFSDRSSFNKNGRLQTFMGSLAGLEGVQQFVTLDDGTGCMQLVAHKYAGTDNNNYSDYRMMFTPAAKGVVTADHKYMRVTYMTTDPVPGTVVVTNNANGAKAVLVNDTSVSRGRFVTAGAVDISAAKGILDRYSNSTHCSFEYKSTVADGKFYIKEIAFFSNEKQAYEYYGDAKDATSVEFTEVHFGTNGNGVVVREFDTWGNQQTNDDSVDILYSNNVHWNNINYMAKIKPAERGIITANDRYLRILYSADNPDGVDTAAMFLVDDAKGTKVLVSDKVKDTNGEFVLTEPVYLSENMATRFSISVFCTLFLNTAKDGGKYTVKAAYFFPTYEDAQLFEANSSKTELTIAGNDISDYRIVVSKDTTLNVRAAADSIALAIKKLCGVSVPVVTDETAESAYEILVGRTNRELSNKYLDEMAAVSELSYKVFVENNKLVITAPMAFVVPSAVEIINKALFYDGVLGAPETVDVSAQYKIDAVENTYKPGDFWNSGESVDAPTVFTEDFDVNDGYFNEDNGEKNWKYENGVYKTDAADFAASYLHVFEKNITYKAKLTYKSANGGSMGIMARVNSEDSFVKAGYDFARGEWYIESRESRDYYLERVASKAAVIAPDTVYELDLTVMGETSTLTVNGEAVITDAKLTHFSPGRLGIYAENASVAVDDIEIVLVSGQGTILQNVAHTKLPDEVYREGGSVFERADGSLTYVHQSGATFKSLDNGITWERTETWSDNHKNGYVNMFKLTSGEWIRIVTRGTDKASQISVDDGMTWTDGGIICETKYKGTTAVAGNMNDKITQGTDGRIYYVQAYESTASTGAGGNVLVEGRYIFCRYYFSDDKGMTWQKGADSWEIPGNDEEWFGENKLLECADGTVRMYCSWNFMGNIYYADSTDGGKTFGPLTKLDGFYCPTSSMQFVKDEYADNDHTYYMVWVNAVQVGSNSHTPRSRLSLAKSTDGKSWVYLGDIWRWEGTYLQGTNLMNHVVDPFIKTTEDHIICGSGFSDGMKVPNEGGAAPHQGQRQHIYSIRKDTLPEGMPLNKFTDVTFGSSAYEAITFVTEEGLFRGTSETTFDSNAPMTRAMFVTVLGRLNGADMTAYTVPTFNDVAAGQWYTSYVEWAAANGIVNGLGNGIYGINDNVTVEQACVILARYADYKVAANGTGKAAASFTDGASVASWAAKEVDWAVANGIYTGSAGRLDPSAPATRATVAVMFSNYVKAFG